MGDLISISPVIGSGEHDSASWQIASAVAMGGDTWTLRLVILRHAECAIAVNPRFKRDFGILPFQFKLRDGVFLHQINDGFDIF